MAPYSNDTIAESDSSSDEEDTNPENYIQPILGLNQNIIVNTIAGPTSLGEGNLFNINEIKTMILTRLKSVLNAQNGRANGNIINMVIWKNVRKFLQENPKGYAYIRLFVRMAHPNTYSINNKLGHVSYGASSISLTDPIHNDPEPWNRMLELLMLNMDDDLFEINQNVNTNKYYFDYKIMMGFATAHPDNATFHTYEPNYTYATSPFGVDFHIYVGNTT